MIRRSTFTRTADALRSLDPAPPTALTEAEAQHATAERNRIMATPVAVTARIRTPRPYRRLALAAGAIVAVTALVPFAFGGTPAFASWTEAPSPLTGAAAAEAAADCTERLGATDSSAGSSAQDVDLVIAEQRGDWITVILSGPEREAYCLLPADRASSERPIMAFHDPNASQPAMPEPDGLIETFSMGGAVDVPNRIGIGTIRDWYGWVAGYVGSNVTGVTVHSPNGSDIEASVSEGRYSAWWPAGPARGDNPAVGGGWSYTVTLSDGTTHEIGDPHP